MVTLSVSQVISIACGSGYAPEDGDIMGDITTNDSSWNS